MFCMLYYIVVLASKVIEYKRNNIGYAHLMCYSIIFTLVHFCIKTIIILPLYSSNTYEYTHT